MRVNSRRILEDARRWAEADKVTDAILAEHAALIARIKRATRPESKPLTHNPFRALQPARATRMAR